MKNKTAQEVAQSNLDIVLKKGPGLRYSYSFYCMGRDRAKLKALKGGLGAMGCGSYWTEERFCKDYPGFDDAPEMPFPEDKITMVNILW